MYIPRWYYYVVPCFVKDMSFNEPWITLGSDDRTKDKIVVFRSSRYQNKFVDYSFLNGHKDKFVFIGLDDEYNEFKKMIDCERIEIKNALEAANLIGSAKLVIGNQTFFYSLAESAKKIVYANFQIFVLIHMLMEDYAMIFFLLSNLKL